jgi:hypothetical protein
MNRIVWRPFSHLVHLKDRRHQSEFSISRLSYYQARLFHTSYSSSSRLTFMAHCFTDSLLCFSSSKEWVEACPKVQRHWVDLVHPDSKHLFKRLRYPLPMFLHLMNYARVPYFALVRCHSKFKIVDYWIPPSSLILLQDSFFKSYSFNCESPSCCDLVMKLNQNWPRF